MTGLKRHWDSLRPYQRELTWTAAFGLSGLIVFAVAGYLLYLAWPSLLADPVNLVPLTVVGSLWGLGSAIGGMLLGYRIEDRHERKTQAGHYGGGLRSIPEQPVDRDDDTGLPIQEWAEQQWEYFEAHTAAWLVGESQTPACPYCYATALGEQSGYLASTHSNAQARARWGRHHAKWNRKREALGACRCALRLHPGQAAADAARELGRYTF